MTIVGKMLRGIVGAGASVLSLVSPTLGAVATKAVAGYVHSGDPVSVSGQVIAAGAVKSVAATTAAVADEVGTLADRKTNYDKLISQGYSPQAAGNLSGLTNITTLPSWLIYGAIGLVALLILPKLLKSR